MATFQNLSGTSDFTVTRDNIITRALRICSAVADEELPTPSMIANGSEALNAMVKQWDAMGIHVWTQSEGVLFLQPRQYQYQLDPRSSPDHAAENWILSSTASGYGAGTTVIELGERFNFGQNTINIGDNIGIILEDGTVFWALVALPDPLTLHTPLTGSASGNTPVFIYTDRILQPLRIPSSRRFILSNQIDTPMLVLSRLDYGEMPNKATPGTITSFFYNPQLLTGYYYVWPAPSDVNSIVRFTWYRRMQDFNTADDTPDLPQEWSNAITWNLAKEIAPEYDVPLQKYTSVILQRAAETLDMASGWDREPEPTYFGVAFTPSSR